MSGRDEEGRAGIEELLRISEEEEARALRDELIQFLRSDECRAEVAAVIQKPLETLVAQTLTSAHFIESVREQLAEALTPMMRKTATEAAHEAFRNLDIRMPEDERTKIRKTATDTVQSTFTVALQSGAKDQLPALSEEVRKLVRSRTEEAVKSGAKDAAANLGTSWIDPISNAVSAAVQTAIRQTLEVKADGADARIVVAPAAPSAVRPELLVTTPTATPAAVPPGARGKTSRVGRFIADFKAMPRLAKRMIAFLGVIAVVLAATLWVFRSPGVIADGIPPNTTATTDTTTTHAPRPAQPQGQVQPAPLYLDYIAAFREQARNLPQAATLRGDTLECIDRSIATSTTPQAVSVQKLRDQLTRCAELKATPPQDASVVVATLQWQFATVLQECATANRTITVDGQKGPGTNNALREYISCRNPADVPSELKTFADYVTVTLVILRERALEVRQ